ncbi:dihydrodipicolinate synthase family protein [Chitinophaga niabensis]|uniref:Dihydrodipicolinate synthase/N-acetylneuraminate lyase n=1 Tax=Chitinophaga niabensis TaxID=536979 RepID=A0A1N6H192_9BACT|nr:dihydrodipicolinate synthase family protein [Chitinophaga niabensis]SIO13588.1 Dihydrodipicolinate synthase/N-acetylneuraminate lyase [Chitinophaga niabensis]
MAQLKEHIKALLQKGAFIPAHPLALNEDLSIDEKSQRRLTRYYMASGVDGVAVGVHTTQFEVRQPEFNYLEPVLRMAAEEVGDRPLIKVAGICGPLKSAVKDAELALKYGYDLGLLSMGGLQNATEQELIERTKVIAEMIPVFGFYLQPAVGGRVLSYDFWKAFAAIPNVQAIKVAAFNRYQTLDVVRAIADTDIILYTGNDDNIVADLVTPYRFGEKEKRFIGGLLGHYAVWTHRSVELFRRIREGHADLDTLLATGIEVTDMNAAIFDPKNAFKGCIAGIHEVLRRQGLMKGIWCLNPHEKLSPGQAEEITRVVNAYPHLVEDEFVKKFLENDH